MAMITTNGGDQWDVIETDRHGTPTRVQHRDEWMRGAFLEQRVNVSLAVHRVKVELRYALPTWLQTFIPPPKQFWESRASVREPQ